MRELDGTVGEAHEPERDALPLAGRRTVRAWLWRLVRAHRGAFMAMIGLFGLATAAGLVGPWLLGVLVEELRRGTTAATIDLLAAAFVGMLLLQALLRRWGRFVAAVCGERLLGQAREELVDQVVRLPLDTVESAGTGELLGRATSDVDKLDEGLRQAAPEIVIASIMVMLTGAAMVLTSPLLAAGALVSVPVLVVATRWYRPRVIPSFERSLADWARVHASTHETVVGGRTVEALGLADRRMVHQRAALRQMVRSERRVVRLWAGYVSALDAASVLPVAAILLLGALAYQRGWVGIGEVTTTVLYARAISEPLNEVLGWMDELQMGHAALRRVLGIRELPADSGDPNLSPNGRHIRLRNVRFAYRPGHEVLRGVDLDIAPGERIVVVGPSGAGKSTLGRLLAGVNPPDAGTVSVGGVELSALPLERRRREVVLVTQEQHVFAATLRENLTLARDAEDDELWQALAAVGARNWAKALPNGLNTSVGVGGEPVPPAVAQQIALARLVLADPHTLVLDEATSLMDGAASHGDPDECARAPSAIWRDRTVVDIAHQLHSVDSADRVIVMSEGRVVEQGTHQELLAAGGDYARLYRTWAAGSRGVSAVSPKESMTRQ